ncbi:MAG: HAMP domain-containing methyl-accepting chemotaxis protein [Candidatus Neomarinimicrobiota bacterium]
MLAFRNLSLGIKIPILLFLALTTLIVPVFYLIYLNETNTAVAGKKSNLVQVSALINKSIEYPMINGEMEVVDILLQNIAREATVTSIDLLDPEFTVYLTTRTENQSISHGASIKSQVIDSKAAAFDESRFADGLITLYDPILFEASCLDCHTGASGDIGGVLVTTLATTDILTRARSSRVLFLSVCLVLLIVSAGVLFLVIRVQILKPLIAVILSVKDIAQGEGDLTRRLLVENRDELGVLSKWFNTFIEKIQQIILQVRNGVGEIAEVAQNVSASSNQLASGAEEQQTQTAEVAASVEEMAAAILQSSNNSGQVLDSARQAADVSGTGGKVVRKAVRGMSRISEAVQTSSRRIEDLGRKSEEIGQIVKVIEDIADQTNLLALNANIEAARAGDQGRGFAVVADEVRILAERTTRATSEIDGVIKGIQNGIGSVVKAMDDSIAQVNQGVALVEETGQSLERINTMVESVEKSVNQIAISAQEQSSGAEQISANVEGISTITGQSADAARQMTIAAEKLNFTTGELNELMRQFKL